MQRMRMIAVAASVLMAAGCAQTYEPVIDPQGVDETQYQADLAECRQLAEQVDPGRQAVGGGAVGAMFGSALGAALGATYGGAGRGAARGAIAGGGTGVAAGAGAGARDQISVINNCLRNRGYAVLR